MRGRPGASLARELRYKLNSTDTLSVFVSKTGIKAAESFD